MCILLTGGTGYIGSHIAVQLLGAGREVVLYDNFSNSNARVARAIATISGKSAPLVTGDIRDSAMLRHTIEQHHCTSVIHLAGLKAVGESVTHPLGYFGNNIAGTVTLLEVMQQCQINTLVFSSSATVYGAPQYLPLDEDHPTRAVNPYGRTKLHIEEMLHDICIANQDFTAVCLRYFNPAGAHASGLIGELPVGIPNNLMPYICQTAAGIRDQVQVFGGDYPTPDGTGIRDYIHIEDLAKGHLQALDYAAQTSGWQAINLGTGKGYSVLEVLSHFADACGSPVPHQIMPRRSGDVASCYAAVDKAATLLQWRATHDMDAMCQSAWHWQQCLDGGTATA